MFDQHDRPLKREYETLGWQALPQLGQRDRMNRGRVMGIVASEGVATDELGQAAGLMGRGRALGSHLPQHHVDSARGQLVSALTTGESATDDVNRRRHRVGL